MVAVPTLPISDVIGVVNHYGSVPRAADGTADDGFAELTEVLGPSAAGFPRLPAATIRKLADEAYAVFAAAQQGADVAAPVNSLLAAATPTPTCTDECGIEWEVDDGRNALRAAVGVTLLDWLHSRGAERLGTCRGSRCADAFADLSPSGRKVFCSNGCLNRHKVAEHRRRAKSA